MPMKIVDGSSEVGEGLIGQLILKNEIYIWHIDMDNSMAAARGKGGEGGEVGKWG